MLGHKVSLDKFQKIEILQNMLSDGNGIKLEIRTNKVSSEVPNSWKLNNTILHKTLVKPQM